MVGEPASDYTRAVQQAQREVTHDKPRVTLRHSLKSGEFVQHYSRTGRYVHGPCELTTTVWLDGSIEQHVDGRRQTS